MPLFIAEATTVPWGPEPLRNICQYTTLYGYHIYTISVYAQQHQIFHLCMLSVIKLLSTYAVAMNQCPPKHTNLVCACAWVCTHSADYTYLHTLEYHHQRWVILARKFYWRHHTSFILGLYPESAIVILFTHFNNFRNKSNKS